MKRKKKRSFPQELPPEGLWITPSGKRIVVIEHLLALAEFPEVFGLAGQPKLDTKELRDLAEGLIAEGWVRYRFLSGTHAFELRDARDRVSVIEDVLAHVGAHEFESVSISQPEPLREWNATVADVFNRSIFRFSNNPRRNTWRFSN